MAICRVDATVSVLGLVDHVFGLRVMAKCPASFGVLESRVVDSKAHATKEVSCHFKRDQSVT